MIPYHASPSPHPLQIPCVAKVHRGTQGHTCVMWPDLPGPGNGGLIAISALLSSLFSTHPAPNVLLPSPCKPAAAAHRSPPTRTGPGQQTRSRPPPPSRSPPPPQGPPGWRASPRPGPLGRPPRRPLGRLARRPLPRPAPRRPGAALGSVADTDVASRRPSAIRPLARPPLCTAIGSASLPSPTGSRPFIEKLRIPPPFPSCHPPQAAPLPLLPVFPFASPQTRHLFRFPSLNQPSPPPSSPPRRRCPTPGPSRPPTRSPPAARPG